MDLETPSQVLLEAALRRFSRSQLANELGRDPRTISRWEKGTLDRGDRMSLLYLLDRSGPPGMADSSAEFTFIDLFAGIGGTRIGFERNGGQCVFTSEWDESAQKTYLANHHTNDHKIIGDICDVTRSGQWDLIPKHDVLVAGFPCQPFSIAGVSKKNALGRAHGFACEAQGTLFFEIAKILDKKQPNAFLLENVKNLQSHDNKNTFRVIQDVLERELEYQIFPLVVDAKGFVPQHRERIYIVGFRQPVNFSWKAFRAPRPDSRVMRDILHPEDGTEAIDDRFTYGKRGRVLPKYTLSDKLWKYLQDYARKHQKLGNGFGFGLVGRDDVARTLSARYYKDGSEILVSQGPRRNPRRLTPRECARLMGFDTPEKEFRIVVADTPAYKQFGNSVVVPVISEIARIMKPAILDLKSGVVQPSLLAA